MSEPIDPSAVPVPGLADDSGYRPPPAFAPRYGAAAQPRLGPYFPPGYAPSPWIPAASTEQLAHPNWSAQGDPVAEWERKRKVGIWLYAVIAVIAAVGVIVAIIVATSRSDPATTHRLGLPTSFDGYTKIEGSASNQVEMSMRSLGAASPSTAAIFNAASIGVYSRNTGDLPGLIALTLPSSKIPGTAGQSSDQIAAELVRGALTPDRTIDMPPGPHGGSVKCGQTTVQGMTVAVCAWADGRATGLLLAIRPIVTPTRLAQIENDFRDKVE